MHVERYGPPCPHMPETAWEPLARAHIVVDSCRDFPRRAPHWHVTVQVVGHCTVDGTMLADTIHTSAHAARDEAIDVLRDVSKRYEIETYEVVNA